MPKALKVSYSKRSSTFSSRFPMNKFAPTSSCFLSDDAYSIRRNGHMSEVNSKLVERARM